MQYGSTLQRLSRDILPGLQAREYEGDPREPFPDPRKFRARCFACEPPTEAEQALAAETEASNPPRQNIIALLEKLLQEEQSADG